MKVKNKVNTVTNSFTYHDLLETFLVDHVLDKSLDIWSGPFDLSQHQTTTTTHTEHVDMSM